MSFNSYMKVTGDNVILYEYVSGDWVPYACAQNISVNFTTDFIETSVSGSGNWATFLPTKISWTASIDGIVSLEEAGKLSIVDLRTKQFEQTQIQIKFERTDDDGNIYANVGYAYISNSSDTGSFNGMDTFSVEFRGSGNVVQNIDPAIHVDYYNVSVSHILLCTSFRTVLYSTDVIGPGVTFYVDSALSIPLTGKNFIKLFGAEEIYSIDDVTGTVATLTVYTCP